MEGSEADGMPERAKAYVRFCQRSKEEMMPGNQTNAGSLTVFMIRKSRSEEIHGPLQRKHFWLLGPPSIGRHRM